MSSDKYRTKDLANAVIGFSISHDRRDLLARGMGPEHLRDLLFRLARVILRRGANVAYGGNWDEKEKDNFTFDLLRVVSAEQLDFTMADGNTEQRIGKLYNHSSWPYYLKITPKIEAQWIDCCKIIRVTQQDAGFSKAELVRDQDFNKDDARSRFNAAVTLSAMRRCMMKRMTISSPDAPEERIPPVAARILLGGRLESYSGFVPGLFEEALVALELGRPLYILGGFGGAAEMLADSMLASGRNRPEELTLAWHKKRNASLAQLLADAAKFRKPKDFRSSKELLDGLFGFVQKARKNLCGTLQTGLSDKETRELLKTRGVSTAIRLVREGLQAQDKLRALPL